jgi:hypothetical protein
MAEAARELVEILLGLQGQVILSGYAHPVYEALVEAGWEKRISRRFVRQPDVPGMVERYRERR